MEFNIIELIGMMAGTGTVTGGVTLAGLRVHIQYLREQDRRHVAESDAMKTRLDTVEKEVIHCQSMAERAHSRLDHMKAVQ